jgi:hypothetical protein
MHSLIQLLGAAGIIVASTVHAQAPEGVLLSRVQHDYGTAGAFRPIAAARIHTTAGLIAGERSLLGRVDDRAGPADPAGFAGSPIDGPRALLGKLPSAISVRPGDGAHPSSFLADVRGHVTTNSWGEAEFGAVQGGDGPPSGFVVSLGARGGRSAILFTRMSGAPLGVGRYQISDPENGAAELMALVMTGSPTNPTGVFRGRWGWLVVTAASDDLVTGRFQFDGGGFLAAEPRAEDRAVSVAGSFSATRRARDRR